MPNFPGVSHTLPGQTALHSLLLDSLEEQIAMIDSEGSIVYVIRTWTALGITRFIYSFAAGSLLSLARV